MSILNASSSQGLRLVSAQVLESHPSGIKVAFLDGLQQKGLIRPREFTWERRVSVSSLDLPKKGEVLQCVILPEKYHGDSILLSIKRKTDPWQEAIKSRKYKVGQIVEGEVVNTRNTGIYVQLEPGVDGVIAPRDIPRLREQSIEDILWLGDKVDVKILSIDSNRQLINLSLVKRLQELSLDVEEQKKNLLAYFGTVGHPRNLDLERKRKNIITFDQEKQFIRTRLGKIQRLLIIDNEEEWLDLLGQGLKEEFSAKVDIAFNGKQALEKIQGNNIYDIIIIDIHLDGGEVGTNVAGQIRQINRDVNILLVSLADFDEYGNVYHKYDYPFCYKSLNDIVQKIDDLRRGYFFMLRRELKESGSSYVHQLGIQALSNRLPVDLYSEILDWLQNQAGVDHCILLELDRKQHTGKIIASKPPMSEDEIHHAQDGLYYTPARQVVEEEREFYENAIDFEKDSKFENFLKNIYYESCLGVPVLIPDWSTRFALFLLDEDPLSFLEKEEDGAQRFLYARVASYFLTVAIERSALFEYMQQYEIRYSLGQLLADMIHELNNKISTIETSLLNFQEHQKKPPPLSEITQVRRWLDESNKIVDQFSQHQTELKELVKSYSRQAKNEYDAIDVNQIITELKRQLDRDAKKARVNIILDQADYLPSVRAIRSQLQQVFLNLGLNSIQMISHQRDLINVFGEQFGKFIPAVQAGTIIIQTRYGGEQADYPIEIRFIDNGPGIHWRDQERIFAPGFTRRSGGAGLGLYISRNLVERMGGRLSLFNSIMFMGSAFLIELQSYSDV